jgi:hypothetical protein
LLCTENRAVLPSDPERYRVRLDEVDHPEARCGFGQSNKEVGDVGKKRKARTSRDLSGFPDQWDDCCLWGRSGAYTHCNFSPNQHPNPNGNPRTYLYTNSHGNIDAHTKTYVHRWCIKDRLHVKQEWEL